jgi:hypothetical protein
MTRKVLIDRASKRASQEIVLGAGLEPASLSAYAPQTYVSASSTTRASRGSKLSADGNRWQVSSAFFLLMLMLVLAVVIEGSRQTEFFAE